MEILKNMYAHSVESSIRKCLHLYGYGLNLSMLKNHFWAYCRVPHEKCGTKFSNSFRFSLVISNITMASFQELSEFESASPEKHPRMGFICYTHKRWSVQWACELDLLGNVSD